MSSRRPATNGTPEAGDGRRNSVVLGPKDRLIGQLYIEGDLSIAGTVEGALEATGDIEIGRGGKVKGPVTAYNKLVVGPDASLNGDVRVARLVVEDGATFSGNVQMGKAAVTAAPPPVEVAAAPPVPEAEAPPEVPPVVVAEPRSEARSEPVKPKGKRR